MEAGSGKQLCGQGHNGWNEEKIKVSCTGQASSKGEFTVRVCLFGVDSFVWRWLVCLTFVCSRWLARSFGVGSFVWRLFVYLVFVCCKLVRSFDVCFSFGSFGVCLFHVDSSTRLALVCLFIYLSHVCLLCVSWFV